MSQTSAQQRNFPTQAEWLLIMQTAAHVWKSGMANDYNLKSESSVILVMLKGWELGLGLMASLDHVRVIHGRVSPSAEAMQGLVLHKVPGARFKWLRDGRDGVAEVVAVRPGHEPLRVAYSLEDAQKGGVAQKNPTYRTWQPQLLRAGAMRQACRMAFADIILGFDDAETGEVPPLESEALPAPLPRLAEVGTEKQLPAPAVERPALPSGKQVVEQAEEHEREPGEDDVIVDIPLPKGLADAVLPFDQGRWHGVKLSDVKEEADFRYLMAGFDKAAQAALSRGDQERADDRMKWHGELKKWGIYRGFGV
jgi:hypothetical protein